MRPTSIAVLFGLAGVMGVGGLVAARYLNPGAQKITDPGTKTTKNPGSSTTKAPDGTTITKAKRLADLQSKRTQIEAQLKNAKDTITKAEADSKRMCYELRFEIEPFCIVCGKGPMNDAIDSECLEFVQGKRTLSAQTHADLSRSKNLSKFQTMARDYADASAKIKSNETTLKFIVAEINKLESEGVL